MMLSDRPSVVSKEIGDCKELIGKFLDVHESARVTFTCPAIRRVRRHGIETERSSCRGSSGCSRHHSRTYNSSSRGWSVFRLGRTQRRATRRSSLIYAAPRARRGGCAERRRLRGFHVCG
jgi:hypothetical protein